MCAEAGVRLVVEPTDRGVLDGSVHPLNLAVCPWVIELSEAMVDAELSAGEIKGVGPEELLAHEKLFDLPDAPARRSRITGEWTFSEPLA